MRRVVDGHYYYEALRLRQVAQQVVQAVVPKSGSGPRGGKKADGVAAARGPCTIAM
jgi:hypothetical protein